MAHEERMSNMRVPKKISANEMNLKKRRERPKSKWRYEIELDLLTMGMESWKNKVTNKKGWRSRTFQAMGLLGRMKDSSHFGVFVAQNNFQVFCIT